MADNIIYTDKVNFDSTVKEGVTLVDFWAEWCGPCKMIAPVLEKLADEWVGKVKIAKLNTDNDPEVAALYGIQGIPTLILFKDGKVADRITGAAPKNVYEDLIKRHVSE